MEGLWDPYAYLDYPDNPDNPHKDSRYYGETTTFKEVSKCDICFKKNTNTQTGCCQRTMCEECYKTCCCIGGMWLCPFCKKIKS